MMSRLAVGLALAFAVAAGFLPPPASATTGASPPAWTRDAVLYGAIVERFGERGNFDSVRARLDELGRLGIDAIWLSPVNATPPDDFGYAVTGYRRLRRTYGGKADFARLIDAAHRRGIRVLMDLVPNHTSRQHRWYLEAREGGPGSRYWRYYERDRYGHAKHYFDWENLPNLNYSNEEVRRRMLRISAYWVREFGIDGYRVDAAWGVRRRAPGFWPRWARELRRLDSNVLLLAEASAGRPWYARHGFDAAYDWTGELGHGAWEGVFERPATAGSRLGEALADTPNGLAGSLVLRYLENNDTGERFAERYGVGTTKVAATVELTVPGMPLIYSGQEVGASFDPYSLAEPVDFRDRLGLRSHYRRLIHLRHRLGALSGRDLVEVGTGPDSTIAYVRPDSAERSPVLVAANFSRRARTIGLRRLPALAPFLAEPLADEISGRRLPELDPAAPRLRVPPMTAWIMVPQAS